MSPASPPSYHESLRAWIDNHRNEPGTLAHLRSHARVITLFWHLDLEPARPVLQACYADNCRGGHPWDPVVVLRTMLLGLLVGEPRINSWARRLRFDPVLRAIAGIQPGRSSASPSVGAFYDFMYRLHDGPQRDVAVLPSDSERARTKAPRPPQRKKSAGKKAPKPQKGQAPAVASPAETPEPDQQAKEKSSKKANKGKNADKARKTNKEKREENPKKSGAARSASSSQPAREATEPDATDRAELETATAKLVAEIEAARHLASPADLLSRLATILFKVGVRPSMERGLLGDLSNLITAGDGSALPTYSNGHGKKTCTHGRREQCDCPRVYSDPDARSGWDPYRKCYYFGHKFYEICESASGRALPLHIRLDPANESDHTSSVKAYEHLLKQLRAQLERIGISTAVLDTGHDSDANHRYLRSRNIRPVIPLSSNVPAAHPERPEISLSRNAIPLCQANVEMASWGTGGTGRPLFVCPVKANKLDRCPLAPKDPGAEPNWVCQPNTQLGPSLHLKTDDAPRLFPEISRNSAGFAKLYATRTTCERSNSTKKETYNLLDCHHRRKSFWLIRLYQMALLQHATAWISEMDALAFFDKTFGLEQREAA
jgi:hypothetical protein